MQNIKPGIAKAGTLLMISDGTYSSYQINGFFVVLTDFEPETLLREFWPEKSMPENLLERNFKPTGFLAFLLRKGLLLEVNYGELWCGDYGQAYGSDGVQFWPIGDPRFAQ